MAQPSTAWIWFRHRGQIWRGTAVLTYMQKPEVVDRVLHHLDLKTVILE
ncbi:hypothetical protein AS9A_2926 [Hoyosella subflava DQS3-9A1]|uniref:Uncharacterized protein n=1 Tax=Hoyosella subflava (strain DSM 45089 / JCM 17490 / NBRC 109087 / DQS3-9A1) TaxID=443218 RepID=F6EK15_HOYSD|nr:hypothetical protein AS9A_2926 [Hoyosella subflava DQS3-9A1]